ncbi:hypothetical protein [Paenibacillus monticola]|uniref:Uncharacterized protein n=1 Tax=Paenibacillus monticola TaxID=2666075 RepID=A0A7X2HAX5_9BACL|nr:hypothetical protein [Paenibacillus monticola]MRN56742.1 hypothetical protein [Paenibacillus monticola]
MTEQGYKRKDQGTSCINNKVHLMIDDLLMTQNVGENQGKWVSAIKEAISMDEKEKLIQLRSMFPYSFENR